MDSSRDNRPLRRLGCPIRRSSDQSLLSGSPKLIAASHVLHRLLAPRHPPCALSSLTTTIRATTLEHSSAYYREIGPYAVFKDHPRGEPASPTGLGTFADSARTEAHFLRSALPRERHTLSGKHTCPSLRCLLFFSREGDGAEGGRTLDLRLAKPALSQLSYSPLLLSSS